jgi:GR25 family glycosyltransferase involved in LPS biosynthesis
VTLPPAVVINLDRAPERLARMQQSWPQGLPMERFAAVDGATLGDGYEIGGARFTKTEAMSRNEFACLLSHVSLWSQLASGTAPAMMIFEDDVYLPPDFAARCSAFFAKLPADFDIAYLTYNTDMHVLLDMPGLGEILLMHEQKYLPPELLSAPAQDSHPCRLYRAWGLPAYILSRKGAAILLAHFTGPSAASPPRYQFALPNGFGGERVFDMPTGQVDLRLLPLFRSLQAYAAIPMLCLPDLESASTIAERGWSQPA